MVRCALTSQTAIALGTVYYFTPRISLDSSASYTSVDADPAPDTIQAEGKGLIPFSEVQKHNTPDDCWVVIDGKVYDLTEVSSKRLPDRESVRSRTTAKPAGHNMSQVPLP
jgi:L-lactate dehydrogenase (cytochrome)